MKEKLKKFEIDSNPQDVHHTPIIHPAVTRDISYTPIIRPAVTRDVRYAPIIRNS